MQFGNTIIVAGALVGLIVSLGTIGWVLHRALTRVENSVKKTEGNTRELVNNGGTSMKDELTVGRGGMVDRQMKMEQQLDLLVDALTTVRTRLEAADSTLNSKVDAVRQDVGSLSTSLGLHIQVSDQQTAIIGTALAQLGADVHLTPAPAVGGATRIPGTAVVIPVLPAH
jgi:hypothetical protein